MKQKFLKPVVTNEKLAAFLALLLAATVFGFFRIFVYQVPGYSSEPSLLKIQDLIQPDQAAQNGSAGLPTTGKETKIPVLTYYHVGPLPAAADDLRIDLTVAPENFELQVAWLKGQGYESLKLGDLPAYFSGDKKLPEKPVILSFDDGYSDTIKYAPPILKKYGFSGDFGIITQFPGITLGHSSYATWAELRQAKSLGMELVSHTQDHFDGTNEKYTDKFILRNLTDSQKDIKDNLGSSVPVLIYPFGHYDKRYLAFAREAGFQVGLTTKNGWLTGATSLMEIPRIRVRGADSLEKFQANLLDLDAK